MLSNLTGFIYSFKVLAVCCFLFLLHNSCPSHDLDIYSWEMSENRPWRLGQEFLFLVRRLPQTRYESLSFFTFQDKQPTDSETIVILKARLRWCALQSMVLLRLVTGNFTFQLPKPSLLACFWCFCIWQANCCWQTFGSAKKTRITVFVGA